MQIVVSQEQGRAPVTVLHVKGDISAETGDQFQTQAQQAIAGGAQNILLDLSQVPYVSSYGIRVISSIYKALRPEAPVPAGPVGEGGITKSPHLKLLNPSPEVQKVLSATGLDMFLEIHRDLKTAVASF